MTWFFNHLPNFWTGAIASLLAVSALLVLYFLKLRRREMPVSSTILWRKAVQDLQVNAPFQRLRRNLLRHVVDSGKIRAAIGPRRSTHADKDGFAEANRFAGVGSVGNFPAIARGNQNLVQVVLVDGNLAGLQLRDARSVDVRADHFMAGFRQARARNQTHITATDHR